MSPRLERNVNFDLSRRVGQDAAALAGWARVGERFDDPCGNVLAGHLHESQGRDIEHLGPGPVVVEDSLEDP